MQTFIDLFSGIGGFRVALEKKGLKCVYSCELDKHAAWAYKQNFRDDPLGDIRLANEADIPPHDVLCAGFPCQSFSLSGKKKGLGDQRGSLFYEIIRIAKHRKPSVILLENVKNILTIQESSVFKQIKKSLERLGYDFYHSVLNCSHFGVPQNRCRVYMVCLRKDTRLRYKAPEPTYEKKYLKDILLPNEECKPLILSKRKYVLYDYPDTNSLLAPIRVGHYLLPSSKSKKVFQGARIYSANGHAITLCANSGGLGAKTGYYLIDDIVRKLHVEECKKLMGFPAKHIASQGQQGYKQLGNAVCVPMVERVFERY